MPEHFSRVKVIAQIRVSPSANTRVYSRARIDCQDGSPDFSLSKRKTDIALRLARPTQELKILAQHIGKLDYAVYALKSIDTAQLPWIDYEDGR